VEFIKQEDGNCSISYENVEKLINQHGLPVGAIHMLAPTGESITNFYFFRGYVHTFLGFEIGNQTDTNPVIALIMALQLIPGWQINTDPNYVMNLKTDVKQNTYFIFRSSGQTCSKYINESSGMVALLNSIMLLRNEDGSEILDQ